MVAGPDGPTRVIGTEMQLLRGEKKDYVLTFTVPDGYEHVTIEPSARYPTVTWAADGEIWHDNSAAHHLVVAARAVGTVGPLVRCGPSRTVVGRRPEILGF